ncbi:DUF2226 domain-containing protein [Methanocaldococcus indicus]|uniref:DUF2226 domain-containing protein n=1 Tax=Methanocaldococcus indicus TaxID=213231 RepID=UPI003C6CEA18
MIKIIEGDYVKTMSELNLDDVLSKVDTGYIIIYAKEGDRFHEGYLFFENGKLVGAYYTDNREVEVFGDRSKVLEILNKENKIIEVYRYTKDKINLLKWLYPEIFKLKLEKDKFEGKYSKDRLSIPLDNLIAKNINDITPFLENNKIILVNIYDKVGTENAYIVYKGKNPILAYYECDKGSLFGNDAYEKIKEILETDKDNYIIDIYDFDEIKLNILLETYPKLKIEEVEEEKIEEIEAKSDDMGAKEIEEINKIEEEEELSREELLKRLGITEPDEEWVEEVIEEFMRPDDEFLEELKKEIEEKIKNEILKIDGVKDVNININVKWENGRYYISGEIKIIRKSIFGLFKKEIDPGVIKIIVDKIIKNTIPKYEKYTTHISINIE